MKGKSERSHSFVSSPPAFLLYSRNLCRRNVKISHRPTICVKNETAAKGKCPKLALRNASERRITGPRLSEGGSGSFETLDMLTKLQLPLFDNTTSYEMCHVNE